MWFELKRNVKTGRRNVHVVMIGCQLVSGDLYNMAYMGGVAGLYQGKISSHCFCLMLCIYAILYVYNK
jgi:uncharacterized membrane protein